MEQAWSKKLCRQRVANCATHYGWCWQKSSEKVRKINIAIIGKYVELKDAYKSLDEALTHGGLSNNLKVN